jgi:hypothetical protein
MNRECISPGGGVYPITGDATSTAGSPTVRVVGLQGTPVANAGLYSGQVLQYSADENSWVPVLEAQILCNGVAISDDPNISVNVVKPVLVNGV